MRSSSVPWRLWERSKGSGGTSAGLNFSTPTSTSTPSRFKRIISTFKAPAATSSGTTPSDPTPALECPVLAVPDVGLIPSETPNNISNLTLTPSSSQSPVQRAEDVLSQADRLSRSAGETIQRVPDVWEAAKTTVDLFETIVTKLGAFAKAVTVIGEVHPYLKPVTSAINGIVKPIVGQVARDEKFEQLLEEMTIVYDHVIRASSTVSRLKELPANRQTAILRDICDVSEQCAAFIQNEYIRKFWARAAKNTYNGDEVDKTIDRYKSSFSRLGTRWQDEILHQLDGDAVLSRLSPMRHAGPTSQRACLQGTRTGVLDEIREWIDSDDSPRVMFVLGVAGSGKTALANTMAELCRERGELGSFFAFNRGDPSRIPERLLGTVAHHLAHWNEAYHDCLAGILKADVMLADSPDIMRQWTQLIVGPAASISSSGRVLVVIDAFDECPDPADDSRQYLLDCLTRHASALPDSFRLLVTSRPLERVVEAVAAPSVHRLDLSSFPADEDIYLYVRKQIPARDRGGLSDWDCPDIARAADGVFQWAATACRFLASKLGGTTIPNRFGANRERLLHGDPGRTQRLNGPPSLDELYTTVLDDTFDETDPKAMANFRSVLATMLSAETSLSIDILQSIYEQARPSSAGVVKSVLGSMGVVLEGASCTTLPIRPMHLSFREFLLDPARSGTWHITNADTAHGHRILALGGLRLMNSDLRFNMHCLPSSLSPRDEGWLKENTPNPALAYTSPNLHRHLRQVLAWGIGSRNRALFRRAWRRLLYHKLLFWMEWSFTRDWWEGLHPALELAQLMLTGDDICFSTDAGKFMRLVDSTGPPRPAHIYLFGLAFAPATSLVRQRFIHHFPGIPTVSPLRDSWGTLKVAPKTRGTPRMAWSKDCRYIREDTDDAPSRFWDARTGDAVDVPPSVDWRYPSLESADGSVKVSFSRVSPRELEVHVDHSPPRPADRTRDRFAIRTKFNCDDYVADVSPDGKWLLSLDDDGYLTQWNLETSGWQAWSPPRRIGEGKLAATYSPDSSDIVSSEKRDRVHYVYSITEQTYDDELERIPYVYVNFKPQSKLDTEGKEFPDADLRCQRPDMCVPNAYYHLIRRLGDGVRLVLGERLTVDYTDACYGTEWANCYAGTIEAEESEDEYAGVDLEMEESKVEWSSSEGETDEREDD